jgi:hypothetical protein
MSRARREAHRRAEWRRWYRKKKRRQGCCLYCLPGADPLSRTPLDKIRINHYGAYRLAPMRRAYYRKSRGWR